MRNKTFLRVFVVYGMHIWLLIFVCNIVIFYSVRFFIHASMNRAADIEVPVEITASPPDITEMPVFTPTPTSTPAPTSTPTPTPIPVGPVLALSFSLPGIGTNGGNLKPSHTNRTVNIYLYNSDLNTSDKRVKPTYSFKTQAVYDNDPNNPTYTYFINNYVDLGEIVNEGYQIAIQTPQSVRQLIKSNPASLGGQIFYLSHGSFYTLPNQKMITGDIYPSPVGDNIIDRNDFDMFTNCYNDQINPSKCADAEPSDLDDNGVVDGIDYNIMLTNYRTLLSFGMPVPTIPVSPSDIPTKISQTISITPQEDRLTTVSPPPVIAPSKNNFNQIIIFVLIIFALGILVFAVLKFHLLNLLFSRKDKEQDVVQAPPAEESSDAPDKSNIIEKTGYLKKVSADTQKNGVWITLADDAGITRGFYPKSDITDGFVKIKGTLTKDQEYKPYVYISEISREDQV